MFDLTTLTLNKEEVQEVSKAVFEYVLETSDIAKLHDIHTGIQWDTQIPFIGALGLVGREIEQCQPVTNTNKIPMSEKTWTPKLIGGRFEHCEVDIDPLFKLFGKVKRINPDYYDKIDSEELGVVLMRIIDSLKLMIPRIVWFGDTTVQEVQSGGYLTDGTDTYFFSMLDGLWKQIFADIPTTSKYYVEITENAGADYNAQLDLPADFAFNLFRDMYAKADPRFKQLMQSGKVTPMIHCTAAIAENWQAYKETQSLHFTLSNVEGGGLQEMFRNIKIETRYDWDSIIQSYQDDGTTYNLPNRALMTVPSNIPIGTVSTDDLTKVESFYDRYHEVNVMDFRLMLDAKFLSDYLAVAAY